MNCLRVGVTLFLCTIFVMLFSAKMLTVQAQSTAMQDTVMALTVIEEINAWRVGEGLWPLKPNETLTSMAIDQAIYIMSQPQLPQDIHLGPEGETPRERALFDRYDWPHYSLPGQIAIGENAGSGTLNFALDFWRSSATHSQTTLNPAYREIGVAAIPNQNGHFFIVVFGSRPDMLPALVNGDKLYLANEAFEYARFYDSIQQVKQVQIFDSSGQSVTDGWVPWSNTLELPENVSDRVFVLYSDGTHEVLSEVDFAEDTALLPDAASPAETPAPPAPTEVPLVVAAPPQPENVDIRVVYTADTINVINVSGGALDLSGLLLTTGSRSLPIEQFSRVADISLAKLPNNHCLQARLNAIEGGVILPEGCSWVRSLLYVAQDQLFWSQAAEFTITRGEVILANCVRGAGECVADLP